MCSICRALKKISSLSEGISPFPFVNILRTTAEVELINFQHPKDKNDIDTCYKKTAFSLP